MNRDFVMPEDRLAAALLEHPDVPRVLVCSPYRSIAGRTRAALGRGHTPEAPFPASADQRHHEPLRLRRSDPDDPRRSIARYERGIRAAAERMGLNAPAVIHVEPASGRLWVVRVGRPRDLLRVGRLDGIRAASAPLAGLPRRVRMHPRHRQARVRDLRGRARRGRTDRSGRRRAERHRAKRVGPRPATHLHGCSASRLRACSTSGPSGPAWTWPRRARSRRHIPAAHSPSSGGGQRGSLRAAARPSERLLRSPVAPEARSRARLRPPTHA